MEKVLAIANHDGLCWKCLQSFNKDKIHNIVIPEMGYGSAFDGEGTEIHLCENCYQESIKENSELWSMEVRQDVNEGFVYGEEYNHEKEMLDYIKDLPLQGKQFAWNEFTRGWDADWKMDAQDWIDYKLGILPHEKCKEYNLYSPQEIAAYEKRFITCQHPVNRVHSDESKGCWCPFGAYGKYGQLVDECGNVSDECHECEYYIPRLTPIQDINGSDFEEYMEYSRMKLREDELKKKFETI